MNLQKLKQLLTHPKPNVRLSAIHIIGLVDEVRALPTLAERVKTEEVAKVAQELRAVGRHLQELKRDGYDTIEALCTFYNVYSDVLTHADEQEFKRIHSMAFQFSENKDSEQAKINGHIVSTASMMIVSQAFGAGIGAGIVSPGVDMASNVGSLAESMQKQKKRVRPSIPTEHDISRWTQMLKSDSPDMREQALVQINAAKNPKGLQYMAYTHFNDDNQAVRDAAKRLGRALYWNTIYYEMEQNGRIEMVMQDFAATLGIELSADITATQEMPMPEAANESIADILARADQSRKKRGKRR